MKINAAKAIPPGQSGLALAQVLTKWADEQEKEFFKAIDMAAEACDREIKNHVSKGHGLRTGKYKNSFRLASEQPEKHHKYVTWYVEAPHYRLTHLLENGHLTRDGAHRTRAVKHIRYGRKVAEQVLAERMAGLWGNG